jgi:FAD/FMN-containing dehydrogenase
MIDRRPDGIVRCADAADVVTAVSFARHEDLAVAVRGGGHNGAGLGVCDGGVVIDLSSQIWPAITYSPFNHASLSD